MGCDCKTLAACSCAVLEALSAWHATEKERQEKIRAAGLAAGPVSVGRWREIGSLPGSHYLITSPRRNGRFTPLVRSSGNEDLT